MIKCILGLWFILVFAVGGMAQSPTSPNEGLALTRTGTSAPTLSWYGRSGRNYFIQESDNSLAGWYYLTTPVAGANIPISETGSNSVLTLGVTGSAASAFYRLQFDNDQSGLPDAWQIQYFGATSQNPNAFAQGIPGLTLLQSFQEGLNPLDYYNGQLPTLTIAGGNNQIGAPGAILPKPLQIQIANASGTPLSSAPLTFSVGNGGGMLSSDSTGSTLTSTLTLRSGTNGIASAYFQMPSASATTSCVTAMATSGANSVRQTFSESTSGVPANGLELWLRADAGVTLNGANSVTSWTDQSPNGFVLSQGGSGLPQFLPNALNGEPTLNFSGDILQTASPVNIFQGSPSYTVIFVTQPGTSQPAYADILDQDHDTESYVLEENAGTTNQYGNLGLLLNTAQEQVVSMVLSDGTEQDYLNGLEVESGTEGVFLPQIRPFAVGGWVAGGRNYNGNIAEVIIYDRALTSAERSEVESYLGAKYFSAPSSPPNNLVATAVSQSQIGLTWQSGSPSTGEFIIQRRSGANGTYSQIATVNGRLSSFVDGSANSGITYYYRVVAENLGGASQPSAEVTATVSTGGGALPTGCRLWLRADAGVTLGSGSAVASWTDQSSNIFVLSQANTAAQPQLTPNVLNGLPALNFSGDILQTAWAVDIFQGGTNYAVFLVTQPGASQPAYADILDQDHDSTSYALEENEGTTNQYGTLSLQLNSGQEQVVGIVVSDGTEQDYIDGVELKSGYGGISPQVRPFAVGGWINGGRNYNGYIAEVMIYNRTLSNAEVAGVQSYLAQKYGFVTPPAVPTGLVAQPLSGSQISLFWNYSLLTTPTQFIVERATGSGSFAEIATVDNASSYIDTTAMPGTSYTYEVQATNYLGNSALSSPATATTPGGGSGVPLDSLALWLKADGGVNTDSNRNVYYWLDQSGNNNNATQGTVGSQPRLVSGTSEFNGRPALRFNNEYLTIPNPVITGTSNFTWIYVAQLNSISLPYGQQVLMAQGVDSPTGGFFDGYFGGSQVGMQLSTNWYGGTGLIEGPTPQANEELLSVVTYDGASDNMWINGVDQGSAPKTGSNFTGGITAIGCHIEINYFAQADIAEVMVFNRVLDATELNAVTQYLAAKYLLPSFSVDGDGLTIGQDLALGINPFDPDGNGDGLTNGVNIALGINPTNPYLYINGVQADQYTFAQKIALGVDPFTAYTPPSPPPPQPGTALTITLITPPNVVLLP